MTLSKLEATGRWSRKCRNTNRGGIWSRSAAQATTSPSLQVSFWSTAASSRLCFPFSPALVSVHETKHPLVRSKLSGLSELLSESVRPQSAYELRVSPTPRPDSASPMNLESDHPMAVQKLTLSSSSSFSSASLSVIDCFELPSWSSLAVSAFHPVLRTLTSKYHWPAFRLNPSIFRLGSAAIPRIETQCGRSSSPEIWTELPPLPSPSDRQPWGKLVETNLEEPPAVGHNTASQLECGRTVGPRRFAVVDLDTLALAVLRFCAQHFKLLRLHPVPHTLVWLNEVAETVQAEVHVDHHSDTERHERHHAPEHVVDVKGHSRGRGPVPIETEAEARVHTMHSGSQVRPATENVADLPGLTEYGRLGVVPGGRLVLLPIVHQEAARDGPAVCIASCQPAHEERIGPANSQHGSLAHLDQLHFKAVPPLLETHTLRQNRHRHRR
eukprot:3758254-Rhodomonas_salina.2